jgi:hypothetical protein
MLALEITSKAKLYKELSQKVRITPKSAHSVSMLNNFLELPLLSLKLKINELGLIESCPLLNTEIGSVKTIMHLTGLQISMERITLSHLNNSDGDLKRRLNQAQTLLKALIQ